VWLFYFYVFFFFFCFCLGCYYHTKGDENIESGCFDLEDRCEDYKGENLCKAAGAQGLFYYI
jgi:hypothetical protein